MKLFLTFLMLISLTAQADTTIHRYQVGPFSCKEATSMAKFLLESDCQSINQKLESYWATSCKPAGSDGGYVDYFEVEVIGICQ